MISPRSQRIYALTESGLTAREIAREIHCNVRIVERDRERLHDARRAAMGELASLYPQTYNNLIDRQLASNACSAGV